MFEQLCGNTLHFKWDEIVIKLYNCTFSALCVVRMALIRIIIMIAIALVIIIYAYKCIQRSIYKIFNSILMQSNHLRLVIELIPHWILRLSIRLQCNAMRFFCPFVFFLHYFCLLPDTSTRSCLLMVQLLPKRPILLLSLPFSMLLSAFVHRFCFTSVRIKTICKLSLYNFAFPLCYLLCSFSVLLSIFRRMSL